MIFHRVIKKYFILSLIFFGLGFSVFPYGLNFNIVSAQDTPAPEQMPLKDLIDLAEVTSWSDLNKANQLTALAIKRLNKTPDDNLLARVLNVRAYQKALTANYAESLKDALASRPIAIRAKNKEEEAVSYRYEGLIYSLTGNHSAALNLLTKAYEIQQEINSPSIVYTTQYLSLAFDELDQNDKFLEYSQKLYELSEKVGNPVAIGAALSSIGKAHMKMGNFPLAKENLHQSINILKEHSQSLLSDVQYYLATTEYRDGNYQVAKDILFGSDQNAAVRGAGLTFNRRPILKSKIYIQLQQYAQAIELLNMTIIKDNLENSTKRDAYEQLSIAYEKMGEYQRAMQAERDYRRLNNDIYNDQSALQIALAQTRFETAQKERQIIQLESDNQLSALRATRAEEGQKQRTYIIGLTVLLLLVSVYLIWRSYKVRKQLAQNAQELQVAYNKAEAATKSKSDFLARMSHEIRTPMNAIIGLGHLVRKTRLDDQQKDYLSKIQFSADALLGIINDILDFSKIEAGKMDIESIPFSLDKILYSLSSIVAIKAQQKGLELLFDIHSDVPKNIIGDPTRISQILINLVNNAIKFTDHGDIIVSVRAVEKDDALTLLFTVSDTGIGMSEEQQNKMFQSFSQADGTITRKYGGTGLGLSICKQLSELMGGKIWVESELGKGSQFTFTVQAKKDQNHIEDYNPLKERNLKFLIVDDNRAARRVLKEIVTSLGFQADTAQNGIEAVHKIDAMRVVGDIPYHVILMDWEMPGLNGIEAAIKIKSMEDSEIPPSILMVTAHNKKSLMDKAAQAGIEGFLTKPVSASELFNHVLEVMNVNSLNQGQDQNSPQKPTYLEQIRGAKVLVVEDNALNLQVVTEFLEDAGLIVDHAANGQIALDKLYQGQSYDIVLMDIQMPVMDGLTATREIRKNPDFKDLPIIAMTANAMTSDYTNSLNAGMNDHIAKPFDPDRFYQKLLEWVPAQNHHIPPVIDAAQTDNTPPSPFDDTDDDFFEDMFLDDDDLEEADQLIAASKPQTNQTTMAKASPAANLKDFTYIDYKQGLQYMGGNVDRYVKFLSDYRADYSKVGAELEHSFDTDDMEQATIIAHSIKSVAAYCGAQEFSDLAGTIEEYLRANDQTAARELIPNFQQAAQKVWDDILKLNS